MLRITSAVRRAVARPGEIGATEPLEFHSTLGPTDHDAGLGRRPVARRRRRARRRRACAARARARAPDPARRRDATASTATSSRLCTTLTPSPDSRSLGQFGCSRCHCSGAARISSSSSCASSWVIRAMSSRRRPIRCDRERRPHHAEVVAAGRESRPRPAATSRRAQRERRRTAGQRGALAEELDLDPVARRCRGRRAGTRCGCRAAPAARCVETSGPSGTTSMPIAARCSANHSSSSGGSMRSTTASMPVPAARHPRRRPLPPAEVRQREDHAVALLRGRLRCARSRRS